VKNTNLKKDETLTIFIVFLFWNYKDNQFFECASFSGNIFNLTHRSVQSLDGLVKILVTLQLRLPVHDSCFDVCLHYFDVGFVERCDVFVSTLRPDFINCYVFLLPASGNYFHLNVIQQNSGLLHSPLFGCLFVVPVEVLVQRAVLWPGSVNYYFGGNFPENVFDSFELSSWTAFSGSIPFISPFNLNLYIDLNFDC